MFDGKAFGEEMVGIVRSFMDAELSPLRAENEALREQNKALTERIEAIETRELLLPEKGDKGEPGPQGEPGFVDIELVRSMVREEVAALPPAEKGEKGEPGERGEKGEPGKDGADGKDGLGLANALIDREGNLIVTFTDGRDKNLGTVVGKDGADGVNGKDGETFTLDEFDVERIDDRTIKMGFAKGDIMYSWELDLPVVIYRGVWREDEIYQRGDMTTWGGSIWHCNEDNCTSKPDGGSWTLAVKKGRDGRDTK